MITKLFWQQLWQKWISYFFVSTKEEVKATKIENSPEEQRELDNYLDIEKVCEEHLIPLANHEPFRHTKYSYDVRFDHLNNPLRISERDFFEILDFVSESKNEKRAKQHWLSLCEIYTHFSMMSEIKIFTKNEKLEVWELNKGAYDCMKNSFMIKGLGGPLVEFLFENFCWELIDCRNTSMYDRKPEYSSFFDKASKSVSQFMQSASDDVQERRRRNFAYGIEFTFDQNIVDEIIENSQEELIKRLKASDDVLASMNREATEATEKSIEAAKKEQASNMLEPFRKTSDLYDGVMDDVLKDAAKSEIGEDILKDILGGMETLDRTHS